jgi:sortase B
MINWKTDTNANKLVQKKIEEYIKIDKKQQSISINFEELKKINSDTIGYIEIPNTNINYVVVKGKDNSYYLTHNFNKEYNVAGLIFMDYKNTVDGTDKNIVIYGHDVADESMFGSLSKLLDENNLEDNENRIISFITEKEIKKYQIFSIYTIKPEKYYITTDFKEQEFIKFKEKVKERSQIKLEADLDNKNILTLSTCQNYGAKRLAVHAVEI